MFARVLWTFFVLAFTISVAPVAQAASLPTGQWQISSNGFKGKLIITSVDSQGNVRGTWEQQGQAVKIEGFWDEDAMKITFMRIITPTNPSTFQFYTGYLFKDPQGPPQPGTNVTYTLAGIFQAFSGTGATARRSEFGWFAQITQIG